MNELPCLRDTKETKVSGKYIYFPRDAHFNVAVSDDGYIVRASRNGHACCSGLFAKGRTVITINESYRSRSIQTWTNIMVPPEDAEEIAVP